MRKRTLGVLLSLLFFAAPLAAQEQRGGLEGTVKDNTGAVLPGVTVEVQSPALIGVQSATTDANGQYRFPSLPPGAYTVTATLSGFAPTKSIVQVSVGQVPRLELALQIAGVAEQVQVTADATVLDMTSTKTATTINSRVIEELPRGRTFNSLLQVAPGVRPEPKAGNAGVGGYQVDGASGSENVFVIDGVDVSDVRRSSLGEKDAIPFEFVQELQVKSGGFDAEFGGALGGVINVVSKSGTDVFRGEVNYQYTGSGLNSFAKTSNETPNTPANAVTGNPDPRGWFRRNPDDQTQAEFFQPPEDDYSDQSYGFTVGGPLVRDKLRFFMGYVPNTIETDRTIDFRSGGPTNSSSRRLQHRGIGKVDYSPLQSLQFNGSYFWNPRRVDGLLTTNDFKVAPPTTDLSVQGGYTMSNATNIGANWIPSSRFLLSARYGYKYVNDKGNSYGKDDVPYYSFLEPSLGLAGVPAQWQQATGFANVASTLTTVFDRLARHNVYIDGTFFANLGGQNHTIKLGYALNRLSDDVQTDYTQGFFQFHWDEQFIRQGVTDGTRGQYGYYIWQDGVRLNSQVNSRNHGFYIQDTWQISPRLTVNAGVRFENEYLPPFREEQDGVQIQKPIEFGWGDKIAPRVGVAWDVLGTGKWKLGSSYTRINDVLKYELARGSFGGDYWWSHVYTLDNPEISQISKSNPGANGTLITSFDNRSVHINEQGVIEGTDPDIKPMSHDAFDVTSDFLLNSSTVFTVRYVHKHLRRAIEDIGQLVGPSEVYTIGNPGFGITTDADKTPTGASFVPKAKRDYDAVELRLSGRVPRLYYNASYTYSRLYGNWAGLANSDENGRSDPNVSRAFDLPQGNFDFSGQNVYGRLATDRPHTLKLFGNYTLDSKLGATSIGLQQIAYSGTPISSEVVFIVPVFYNGRGDLGRTDVLTQTDLLLSQGFRIGGSRRFLVEAQILNLFNQDAVTNVTSRYNRNGTLNDVDALFAGTLGDIDQHVNPITGASPAQNVIYGQPLNYQPGRMVFLGARFQF